MNDGFRIDDEALATHLSEIDRLAERARKAADTATPLQLDSYGLVGRGFAVLAEDAASTCARAVAEIADAVRRNGEGVRTGHASYVTADRTIAKLLEVFR